MKQTSQKSEDMKHENRAQYWRELYAKFLLEEKDNYWKVRAVCYQPWPLLFNRIMVFFEYYIADLIIKKCRLDFKKKTVLDIGCGTGRWCDYFLTRGAQVIGTDLVLEILAANQRSDWRSVFFATAADNLAFQSDTVDFINAAIVLECVTYSRKADALKEFFRVLRPGGCVFILDPVAGKDYQEAEGTSLLSSKEWRELFRNAGFDILTQRYLHAYPLARLYRTLKVGVARIIKRIKSPKKQIGMEILSERVSGAPATTIKKRHLFYHDADQMILRVIACISFPLEFLWLALGCKGSHEMFLIRKRPIAQSGAMDGRI